MASEKLHSKQLEELFDYLGPKDIDEILRIAKRVNQFIDQRTDGDA
jgi:hypothetical protein